MDRNKNNFLVAGYPRSGNTFLAFAIKKFYKDDYKHILRSHSTIDVELNMGKKICVVIRNPVECIASWNHYRIQTGMHTEHNLTLDADFNYYLRFYNFIEKNLEQIALMDFAKFSNDSNYLIEKIKTKFNETPLLTLSCESLKEEMMSRGGANHLPRNFSLTRQNIENEVLEHQLYNDVVSLYQGLTIKG